MNIEVQRVPLSDILPLRALYLQACNFQIRYNACHERNWTDSYVILIHDQPVGYASVKGLNELKARDALFEFYVLPAYQSKASQCFEQLISTTQVPYLECQSNDLLMTHQVFEFGKNIQSDVILFKEGSQTYIQKPGILFRVRKPGEDVFGKKEEDKGVFVLEKEGEVIADGGFLTHYNPPFADLYMEVKESYRGQGLAAYILQEVKKECYKAHRIPAARCSLSNLASKGSLLKAGFQVAGYMLKGEVK